MTKPSSVARVSLVADLYSRPGTRSDPIRSGRSSVLGGEVMSVSSLLENAGIIPTGSSVSGHLRQCVLHLGLHTRGVIRGVLTVGGRYGG